MPNIMQDLGTKIGSEFKTHRLRIEAVETDKQENLVSGTNIKTINGTSVLGSGDIITTQTTISGNAGTATKLATARTISLTGDVTGNVSFDGSDNVSITATVADDSHNHVISNVDGLQVALDNKVDKVSKQSLDSNSALRVSGTTVSLYKGDGTFDSITTQDTVYTLPTATSTVKGGIGIFSDTVQTVASNSVSTTAGRTYGIQLNSDGQAVVNVPWSDTNTAYTHPNSGVIAGTYSKVTVDTQGHITAGASLSESDIPSLDASKITSGTIDSARLPSFVDDVLEFVNLAGFPTTGEAGKIYIALDTNKTYRWSGSTYVYITSGAVDSVAGKTGVVTLVKDDVGLSLVDNTADASKNVLSATKLATARTIQTNLGSTTSESFNGSANITPGVTGTLPVSNGGTGSTTLTGLVKGNGTSAMSAAVAGTDYVVPSGSITGNAATATKLQTARTIGGVSFDGTANINLPGVNTTGNQNTTGNAASATNVSGGRAVVYGTGNDYHLGGVEVNGNGAGNTVFPTIGFHQPGLYASSLQLRAGGDFRFYAQGGSSYANVTANAFIGNLSGNAATVTNGVYTNSSQALNTDPLRIVDNTLYLYKGDGTSDSVAVAAQKGTATVYGGAKFSLSGTTLTITTT